MDILKLKIQHFAYNEGRLEIKSLGGQTISVGKGEKIAVIGPSGCGKSTLLKIISGLENDFVGSMELNGKTAFVLQEYGLFPWKKVNQNIGLPLRLEKVNKKEIKKRVEEIAEMLGINEIIDKYPDRISGGQKQRVAIGRALITNPDLLLLDEPFNSLDSLTREGIQDMVLDIAYKRNMSFIIVTHNIEESVYMADKVLIMDKNGNNRLMKIDRGSSEYRDFRNTELYYEQVKILRSKLKNSMGGRI